MWGGLPLKNARALPYGFLRSCAHRFFSSSKVFVHPRAVVIGNVKLGKDVSVWPGAVLRGDVNNISIGDYTNIQDNVVIHCTGDWTGPGTGSPTTVGARVSIGHLAMLHGCTIQDDVLIGMNATVMDGALVPSYTVIGAGSLVPPGKVLPVGGLYVGRPVQRVRDLRPEELQWIQDNYSRYVTLKDQYLKGGENVRILQPEDLV